MSRITSSVGLITGIPIEETVTKLMAVAARPRDLLKARNDGLKQQQLALDTLGSRLLSFQFSVNKLKVGSVYQTREVTSSNEDVLTATLPATGTPNVGSFQVRPVQAASAQALVSQRFESAEDAPGSGILSFRKGGFVDTGISLEQLNGGAGVQRGKIRITDRSGASSTIDLSFARTVDDVLAAINSNTDISVSASTNGDTFTLTDASGGSGNLRVQEIGGGTTAAGLGLAGINVASSQAAGADVLRLHAGTKLSTLNDGNGVRISGAGVKDVEVQLSDSTALSIDLADDVTLGDVLGKINAANPAKLSAAIAADGRRIELTDLTGGAGNFIVTNGVASKTAEDLGIVATTSAATISGGRVIAGLRDTLLSSLNGGQGYGTLGSIQITDRAGGTGAVNLSTAETLSDIVDLINAATPQATASVNAARNGLLITDDSGGSGNLVVANNDATNSATKLNIAVNAATAFQNSGALRRQTLSEATLLSALNGGKGVVLGDIKVTDSNGVTKSADLNPLDNEAQTVGDVIAAINALTNGVEARINDAGDGLLLTDAAHSDGILGVQDLSGDIAKSLNLTRASETVDVSGTPTQFIDGTASYEIDLSDLEGPAAGTPLSSLNGGAGVNAGYFVITDSENRSIAIDLKGGDSGVTTVEQLVALINQRATSQGNGFSVRARINDVGNGIQLEQPAVGAGRLTVRDGAGSTAAADLKLAGTGVTVGGKQIINGAGTIPASSAAATGLEALVNRINDLNAGVTASTVFDGVGYRLSLAVDATGNANELLIDAANAGLEFEEVSQAQDALLLYGNFATPGAGVLLASADGKFSGAVGGVDVTVNGASESPVTVAVKQTNASLVDAVEELVESYNAVRTDLGKLTAFDPEALTTGLLFGSNEALQIDTRLSQALTDRYFGFGSFQSLEQIGISVADDGKLELNKTTLQNAFAKDPSGFEEFVTAAETGVAAKLSKVIDRLAGSEESLLAARGDALNESIEANESRLESFAEQLERQQERMLLQFYQLESIIAEMQSSLSAIENLQVLPPLTSSR